MNKGISLVALVITIIVGIILAAIVIHEGAVLEANTKPEIYKAVIMMEDGFKEVDIEDSCIYNANAVITAKDGTRYTTNVYTIIER